MLEPPCEEEEEEEEEEEGLNEGMNKIDSLLVYVIDCGIR